MYAEVSQNFKKKAGQAIFALVLFIILYLVLVFLATVLTILCMAGGLGIIAAKPMALTFLLGIGLASLGVFILVFLFKFIFKQHKIDRSHLVEIFEEDEPEIFKFIEEIVDEVGTDFPKKIYLSSDVNASVFYDSSFWSMFLPIRKNLQLGLGLINTVSKQEFKAILAHEFGHFSQRSMKVGSYVYNINKVIYNMLYDNEDFGYWIDKWANANAFFSLFVRFAVNIIQGIQWILQKMYDFVNLSYMALSREMEFHADEIAANVAGSVPLKESLLRLDLAEYSYHSVFSFYGVKIEDNYKSKNVYEDQTFVMNFLGNENKLDFKNDLPQVSVLELNKYNKSKLNIKDQWASHPSIEERVAALDNLNLIAPEYHAEPANVLLKNKIELQEKFTLDLFSEIDPNHKTTCIKPEVFQNEFADHYSKNRFSKKYNGYYDSKNTVPFDVEKVNSYDNDETFETLFGKEMVDSVYENISIENDKNVLIGIRDNVYKVKSFDYDGEKYNYKEAQTLVENLEEEAKIKQEKLAAHDVNIYKFFYKKALKKGSAEVLKEKYINYFKFNEWYEEKETFYNEFVNSIGFVNVVTPFDEIEKNFVEVAKLEVKLKEEIRQVLTIDLIQSEITKSVKDSFEKYLSQEWNYFSFENYNNEHLNILYSALNNYLFLLSRHYFLVKSDLLNFQLELVN